MGSVPPGVCEAPGRGPAGVIIWPWASAAMVLFAIAPARNSMCSAWCAPMAAKANAAPQSKRFPAATRNACKPTEAFADRSALPTHAGIPMPRDSVAQPVCPVPQRRPCRHRAMEAGVPGVSARLGLAGGVKVSAIAGCPYLSPLHVHQGVDKHGDKRRNPRHHWLGRARLKMRHLCTPARTCLVGAG
jgi:hypothetical protein